MNYQKRRGREIQTQQSSPPQQTESQGEQREVNTGSVDTGYKDYKGRPIKLSPQLAKAFIKMAKDAEAEGILTLDHTSLVILGQMIIIKM